MSGQHLDLDAIRQRKTQQWGRLNSDDAEALLAEVERLRAGIEALYRRGIGRNLAPFDPVLLLVGQSRANNAVLDHDIAWRDRVYALLTPYLQEARRLHILRTMADELGIDVDGDCDECQAPVGHFTDCARAGRGR